MSSATSEAREPAPGPRFAHVGAVTLAYETFGDPADAPLVLVMGLGTQMLAWPDGLCAALAGRGYFVVRFDNRDVGLSTHMGDLPVPGKADLLLGRRPPYRIRDMADDLLSLLDALGLDSVHLVGASMGGFIAQSLVLRHPERVRSLTLMMTSTGSRRVGQPRPRLFSMVLRRRPVTDREGAVARGVETFRAIGSQGYAVDEAHLRDLAGRSYDRSHDPDGYWRQLAAVTAQRDRTRALHRLAVPTLVLHGLSDPLVAPSGGLALARAVPGSRFVGFPGMGHDLPRALWPTFTDEICGLAARADAEPTGSDGAAGPPSP